MNEATRQSEVSRQMELLAEGVSSLQDVLSRLEQRLVKVVREPSPVETAFKNGETPSVDLAVELSGRVGELIRMRTSVGDLIDRIEL